MLRNRFGSGLRVVLAGALALVPSTTRAEPPGPFATITVSEALVRAYNDHDGTALHGLLSPALQARYTPEALHMALTLCRVLTGDIFRLSIPSWGTRTYGFFGVYAEAGTFDMVLEIDEAERIVHWVVSDDVTAGEQQCRVTAASRADDPREPAR